MQTSVFDGFIESISLNIQHLINDFIPDTTFSDCSSVAKTLESLDGQINNLRCALVKCFADEYCKKHNI